MKSEIIQNVCDADRTARSLAGKNKGLLLVQLITIGQLEATNDL